MEIIGIVLAILSFGATCFKAGYSLGKDVEKSAKKQPPIMTRLRLFSCLNH